MSSFSDEENSIATLLQSSHLVETVTSPESHSLPATPGMPRFLSRHATQGFSGFITPLRETLRPIFQLADLPPQEITQPLRSVPPTPSFGDSSPDSVMPTITPSSTHNPTLPSETPVNPRHILIQDPPETLPTNQQQDILIAQSQLDWSVNQSHLDFINNCLVHSALPLPFSFLQDRIPEGLGFSSDCQIWLDKLNIKNWDEFVHVSSNQTIEGLMSLLSVPFYNQHREDLREFLIFGISLSQDSPTKCYPNYRNSRLWMTGHILNLRKHLPRFTDYEKTAIRRLHADFHPKTNTPSPLLSPTPKPISIQPSVNPLPSQPTRPVDPPLQIPQTRVPIQTAPFPPVPDSHILGGVGSLENKGIGTVNHNVDPSLHSEQTSNHSSVKSLVEDENNGLHTHFRSSYPTTKCSTEVRTITPFRNSTPCNPHTGKPLSWIDPLLLSRGEDFPGYTHPISLPNAQEDRVTRIQNSELAYRPLAFLKHSFPNKSQWDGNISTFRAYKHEMEGFYIQNKGRFMFDPNFQKLYCQLGVDKIVGHPSLQLSMNLTKTMLIEAREHLFGSIQISTKKAITVHKYLNKYKDTLDGILVWIALLKEKDNGGNIDVRIQNLFAKTQKSFTTKYPGGLLKFVHDLESTYAELDTLGMCVAEPLRKMNLLGHLDRVNSTVTDFLSQQCRDKYESFEECIAYLKDYATRKESVVQDSSQRRANIVTGDNHLDLPSDDFSPRLDSESSEPFLQGIGDDEDYASL